MLYSRQMAPDSLLHPMAKWYCYDRTCDHIATLGNRLASVAYDAFFFAYGASPSDGTVPARMRSSVDSPKAAYSHLTFSPDTPRLAPASSGDVVQV